MNLPKLTKPSSTIQLVERYLAMTRFKNELVNRLKQVMEKGCVAEIYSQEENYDFNDKTPLYPFLPKIAS